MDGGAPHGYEESSTSAIASRMSSGVSPIPNGRTSSAAESSLDLLIISLAVLFGSFQVRVIRALFAISASPIPFCQPTLGASRGTAATLYAGHTSAPHDRAPACSGFIPVHPVLLNGASR